MFAVHIEPTELPDGLRLSLSNRQAILRYQQPRSDYEERLTRALRAVVAESPAGVSGEPTREAERTHGGERPADDRGARPPGRGFLGSGSAWSRVALGTILILGAAAVGLWSFRAGDEATREAVEEPRAGSVVLDPEVLETVVVLPLDHSAGDHGLEELGRRAVDTLVTELAAKKTFTVVDPDRAEAGDYVLRGRLDRNADRVRFLIRLTASSGDGVLWSQMFEQATTTHGFANVAQIAALVESIIASHWRLTNTFVDTNPQARLENFQGEVEYWRWVIGAGGNIRVAADHWHRAVDLAPTLWPAQRWLTVYHANRFGQDGPLVDYLPVVHASARALLRAAAADFRSEHIAKLASAFTLGKVLQYVDLDYDAAERLYLEARPLALVTNAADDNLGLLYLARGDVRRAIESVQIALAGGGSSAEVAGILLSLGLAQTAAGQYPRARESAERAAAHVFVGTEPHLRAQVLRAQSLCLMADAECAGSIADDILHTYGDTHTERLPGVLALTGRREAATLALEEMERRHDARRLNHYWSSFLGHYHLGNLDAAFLWLDRVIENREVLYFGELRLAPYLVPLREDARFAAAMQRLAELESRVSPLRAEAMKLLE